MRWTLVSTLAAACAAAAPVDLLKEHMKGGLLATHLQRHEVEELRVLREKLGARWAPNTTVAYKNSLVDNLHGTTNATYKQRFFYDLSQCGSTCATTAPILLQVGGEWTVKASPAGSVAELGNQLGAVMVYLEHRFYGQSLPAPLSDRATMQQYLTVEQAIEDIADFIPYFNDLLGSNGNQRQWVIIGGSYAGALVTWFTVAHGDLVTATWSSSGVTNAIFNFTAFDEAVVTAIGPTCSDAVRNVTAAFEDAWVNNNTALLQLYGVPPGYYTKEDFAWMLADSAAQGPQYGQKDAMCNMLLPAGRTSLSGWDALVVFKNWTYTNYGPNFAASCYYSSECLRNQSYSSSWGDSTTWVWQCCSQVAYWQIAYPGSLRSQWLTPQYFIGQCQQAFGATVFPDTVAFNAKYGGASPFVNGSYVFAAQGSDDPWLPAGVTQSLSPTYPEFTAQCDGCSHCKDLKATLPTDSLATTRQRQLVFSQITSWLQPSPQPSTDPPLSFGAVTGIIVGVLALVFLALAVKYGVPQYLCRGCRSQTPGYTSLPTTK